MARAGPSGVTVEENATISATVSEAVAEALEDAKTPPGGGLERGNDGHSGGGI